MVLFLTLTLAGCGSDVGIYTGSRCDGEQNGDEVTVDSVFDADGDGFFDGSNPDCQSIYETLDCNDANAEVNPGVAEVPCDGLDNDCNELTVDATDSDLDGFSSCEDCNDNNTDIFPGAVEVLCDDIDNDCDEATSDGEDQDNDGWSECDDCNDAHTEINPGMTEVECNGRDDDCDDLTPDAPDLDGDGVAACEGDCDDNDAERYEGNQEICDDGIDNDCNGYTDEDCSYSGTWVLTSPVSMSCAYGFVSVSFNTLYVTDNYPQIIVASTSSQPGTTTGSFTSATEFSTSNVITGTCNEYYFFDGEFLDPSSAEGTFRVEFSGSLCLDCTAFSAPFSATRID
jgi:hypothetical protein